MSSTGQIAGGIVGAVIGYFVPGSYPFIGAQIGMMVGGLVDPPKGPNVEGPRLADRSAQTAAYGEFLTRAYGTVMLTGNVFWIENNSIKEVVTKKKSGGKGGGSKTTTRTYSYYATFAVGLVDCSNGEPIAGIRRIWVGPDLFYDAGSTDPDTIAASNDAATGFALYRGSPTQSPDPRIQADLGVDNTPAWRGVAYLVFYDLPLAKYGNSLAGATVRVEVMRKGNVPADYSYSTGYNSFGFAVNSPSIAFGAGLFVLFQQAASTTYHTSPTGVAWTARTRPAAFMAKLAFCRDRFFAGDANAFYTSSDGAGWSASFTTGYSGTVNQWAANASRYAALLTSGPTVIWSSDAATWTAATLPGALPYDALAWNGSLWVAISSASGHVATSPDLAAWTLVATVSTGWSELAVKGSEFVAKKAIATAAVLHSPDGAAWTEYATTYAVISMISLGDEVAFIGADSLLYTSGVGETTWEYNCGMGSFSTAWRGMAWNGSDRIVTTKSTVDDKYLISRTLVTPGASAITYLSEIVSSECLLSGLLSAGDIDVTALTSQVPGYRIGRLGAIRSALEPLQLAWPFDVVQRGYKVVFVPRGGASVVTLAATDLDARGDGESPGVQITQSREMDSQLPQRVTIRHLDLGREYEAGEQSATRISTAAVNMLTHELPIALTATAAAGVAEVLLFLAWMERFDIAFTLPPSYLQLQPGDVCTLPTPEGPAAVRLTSINYTSDGRLECQARLSRAAVYTPAAIGVPGVVVGASTIPRIGASNYVLMDIPAVHFSQDSAGFCAAMSGQYTSWRDGVLMVSTDAGATWSALQDFGSPGATMGVATNSIGSVDARIIDNASQLAVTLSNGELFDVSHLALLGGANLLAYGVDGRWEIIAAQTCTLVTGSSYLLTNFRRGMFGSEWAMGLHAAGDSVVLLDADDVAFIASSSGAIGLTRAYRGITGDRDISTDSNRNFAYLGVNLKPLAPIYATGNRDAATNDWSVWWLRRTRTGGEWRDYVDADLGEASERYEVDVYADGSYSAIKRTIAVSAPTCGYNSADQVADFGSNQGTLHLKIYQLSAVVGRGYPLTISLTR